MDVALTSAPRASSSLTTSTRLKAEANISGVWPMAVSRAFTSAPPSISIVAVLVSPDWAANISGVVPVDEAAFMSEPPATSAATAPL